MLGLAFVLTGARLSFDFDEPKQFLSSQRESMQTKKKNIHIMSSDLSSKEEEETADAFGKVLCSRGSPVSSFTVSSPHSGP